jgi:CRP-like cAMP-binding protein/predicted GNAT family N-acyltransferase
MCESEAVSVAVTQEELEAIYRFRYHVYIEELKRDYPDADHERKWLRDDNDQGPHTVNLYMGPVDAIVAVVRLLIWPARQVPENYHQMFSMEIFPGIEDLVTSEIGRLMVKPNSRGDTVFPTLINAMYEQLVQRGSELCFLYCVPGLVRHYRRNLGARPYGGRLIQAGSSVGIPMVMIVSDSDHFTQAGAIVSDLSRKHFDSGERPKLDASEFATILEGDSVPIKLDEASVWDQFQSQLFQDASSVPTFLSSLSPQAVRKLTSSGFILNLSDGDLVAKSGTEEREVYVILDGLFEVVNEDHRLATLEKGDLFGEIAFFTEAGQRSASVRAISNGKVLVLRRKFLKELTRDDPEAGFQILSNMGRVMAQRITDLNQALLAANRER